MENEEKTDLKNIKGAVFGIPKTAMERHIELANKSLESDRKRLQIIGIIWDNSSLYKTSL